ncbi:MAG: hypothetical protein KBC50_01225 [Candidatus Pacebacteria bacterium]|nr:hypothetical protein [Candidatus Paceibacterota bacterium]
MNNNLTFVEQFLVIISLAGLIAIIKWVYVYFIKNYGDNKNISKVREVVKSKTFRTNLKKVLIFSFFIIFFLGWAPFIYLMFTLN